MSEFLIHPQWRNQRTVWIALANYSPRLLAKVAWQTSLHISRIGEQFFLYNMPSSPSKSSAPSISVYSFIVMCKKNICIWPTLTIFSLSSFSERPKLRNQLSAIQILWQHYYFLSFPPATAAKFFVMNVASWSSIKVYFEFMKKLNQRFNRQKVEKQQ